MQKTLVVVVVLVYLSAYFQGLPKTSYYKLIDWWLIVSLNILVITLVFHTYIARVCVKVEAKDENQVCSYF